MNGELFYLTSMWVIYPASIAVFIAATIGGFLLGRRARSRAGDASLSEVTTIQAGIMGLLGLLLGFSFAMAVSRYDMRKQLVLDEANAIGTTYLRAQLLPGPYPSQVSDLLRRYVDVRLEFYQAGIDRRKLRDANAKTDQLQRRLWSRAVAASKMDPRSVSTGLFVQSLNNVIDIHSMRLMALENHVPGGVFLILYLAATVAMWLTGYACGLADFRGRFPILIAAILIASVTIVIVDLDRPRRGLITVSQQSMLRLQKSLSGHAGNFEF